MSPSGPDDSVVESNPPYSSAQTRSAVAAGSRTDLPTLNRDRSFWGMITTQFLGAFNDNLFKQLMLLLAIPVAVGQNLASARDQQGLATIVFSLPFVLFSGYAGFLSDRLSKRSIIIASKMAEIGVMLLGVAAFISFGSVGYTGLLVVLFLMGTQSAFFGPGKYGILPEMLRRSDLPRANGIMVMTTFLAIIFGTATAGLLKELLYEPDAPPADTAVKLWIGSAACVAIAVVGTISALMIRRVRPAQPNLEFQASSLTIPPETRRFLATDRPLLLTLLTTCVFWLVSGIAIQAVNSLGVVQLELSPTKTSLLAAVIGVGIALGAVLAGKLSKGKAEFGLVRIGSWGIFGCLLVLAIWLPGGKHLLGFGGSLVLLILLGGFAGMFAIPLQVFIQDRPPDNQKGRMIAVMNQMNFIAIMLSGFVYDGFGQAVDFAGWPRCAIFAMMSLIILPVAIFFNPKSAKSDVTITQSDLGKP